MIFDPQADWDGARERLATTGRVRIAGVLGPAAQAIHAAIASSDVPWQRSLDNPANVDISVSLFESQPAAEQARLIDKVHTEATDGFQYLYDRYRLGEARPVGLGAATPLFDVFDLLNSPEGLAVARRLTGDDRIVYADAQATRYLPGHFLNGHTDANEKTGRLYAYVLNLCPRWRAEWGGLLTFLDDGEVVQTFTSGFDMLNVFAVPQRHAVTMVTPFAGAPRYSITGWWRDRGPESWG